MAACMMKALIKVFVVALCACSPSYTSGTALTVSAVLVQAPASTRDKQPASNVCMGHNCLRSCRRMVPLLLFLLCASAAASGGKNWQPNCGSVSSGCTYCSYMRPSGTSNNQRGLRQVQDPISEIAAVLPSGSTSEPVGAPAAEAAAAAVAAVAVAPQAAALSVGSSNSSDQITPQASRRAGRRGAMSRANSSIRQPPDRSNSSRSTGSRAGGPRRSRRSGTTATSSNDGKLSWGYSDTWWQPGAVLSCDECDTSRNYQHLTSANGTGYCGKLHGLQLTGFYAVSVWCTMQHTLSGVCLHYCGSVTLHC